MLAYVKRSKLALGVLVASLAAGPIAMLAFPVVEAIFTGTQALTLGGLDARAFLFFTYVGAIIAFPVNATGAMFMAGLGGHSEVARLKIVWAFAGALTGQFLLLFVDINLRGFLFGAAIGAISALICRAFAEWTED